jgi:hypothetical protein
VLALAFFAWRACREAGTVGAALEGLLSSTPFGVLSAFAFYGVCLFSALRCGAEKKPLVPALCLFGGALAPPLLIPLSKYFPARAGAAPVLFALLGAMELFEPDTPRRRRLAAGAVLLFLLCLLLGTADILQLHTAAAERERVITETLADGGDTVYLTPYVCRTKFAAKYGLADLDPPESAWPRDTIGLYHGIPHLVVVIP